MPLRTRGDRPYRDGEHWDQIVYDHRNPQHTTTNLDPGPVADDPSLRFLTQLHLAGHRLRGPRRPLPGTDDDEVDARSSDASWFAVSLQPGEDGRYAVKQGGRHRLWDTVEAAHSTWLQLGKPRVERFGVTTHDDADHQYVWYDHPESTYRWPLPM